MWRFLSFLIVAAGAAAPAGAAEWWLVSISGEKPDRRLEFVDKSSSTSDYAGRVSAWSFRIYEIPQKGGVRKTKSLLRFNCRDRTMSLVSVIDYGNNSKLLKSHTWQSYELQDDPVVPDSVGEAKWEFACKGKSMLSEPLTASPEEAAATFFHSFD